MASDTSEVRPPIDLEREVASAIMRAFFSRAVELQVINVTVEDNIDLARAAIEAVEEWYELPSELK